MRHSQKKQFHIPHSRILEWNWNWNVDFHSTFHIPMHFSMVGVKYSQKDNSTFHIPKFWNRNWNVDVVRGLIVGVALGLALYAQGRGLDTQGHNRTCRGQLAAACVPPFAVQNCFFFPFSGTRYYPLFAHRRQLLSLAMETKHCQERVEF